MDIIQIPALLCKQTQLLFAVADTKKNVNIKKGQFMTPDDMLYSAEKIESRGNSKILITERGTIFGYHDMIVDFRGIKKMLKFGYPILVDATHSVRIMSKRSDDPYGATREYIPLIARCASAAGSSGLFIETHINPKLAKSDSSACVDFTELESIVSEFLAIYRLVGDFDLKIDNET